jgi:metallo-beta-lactamase class B
MRTLLIGVGLSFVGVSLSLAQAPEPKPDSPAVQAIVARAKAAAGTTWAEEAHFFCEAPRANSPNDPPIEPTKIFDNVYAIGNSGTVAYVFNTSAGLVMIDALGANQVESVLLPGFKALGSTPPRSRRSSSATATPITSAAPPTCRSTTARRSTSRPRTGT